MQSISRRSFFWSGTGVSATLAISPQTKNETVYRFTIGEREVQMSVEFYDRHSREGFWFDERHTNRHFCLSGKGEENGNCLANFSGSLAIARYHVRAHSKTPNSVALREYVRTIDQDDLVPIRPPFERTIEFRGGVASDIQAFGYEREGLSSPGPTVPADNTWSLLRQDLYFAEHSKPFLILHWKHTLDAIRLLDLIPGDETRLVVSKRDK